MIWQVLAAFVLGGVAGYLACVYRYHGRIAVLEHALGAVEQKLDRRDHVFEALERKLAQSEARLCWYERDELWRTEPSGTCT